MNSDYDAPGYRDAREHVMSAHEAYWQSHVFGWGVYQYDPADDGPECEVITRILAHHPFYQPGQELQHLRLMAYLEEVARQLFGVRYRFLDAAQKTAVRMAVIRTKGLGRPVC
jgi:hypothetical protein